MLSIQASANIGMSSKQTSALVQVHNSPTNSNEIKLNLRGYRYFISSLASSEKFAIVLQACEVDLCTKHLRIKPSIFEPNKLIRSNAKKKMPRILLKGSNIRTISSFFNSIIMSSECQLALSNLKIMLLCEGDPSKSYQAIFLPYDHSQTKLSRKLAWLFALTILFDCDHKAKILLDKTWRDLPHKVA